MKKTTLGILLGFLIVSLLLNMITVPIFVYELVQKYRADEETIQILTWKRNLVTGDEIVDADMTVVNVRSEVMNLKGIVRKENRLVVVGVHVSRSVRRGDPVYYKDIFDPPPATQPVTKTGLP